MIKKLQDAYDCDLDLGDSVASIFEGEIDQEKRLIKVVPGYVDRAFSVPVTSNLRPTYLQKRIQEIEQLNANKRQRVGAPPDLSTISEIAPDHPVPSTESDESVDGNDGTHRRSLSKDSVIYVGDSQLEDIADRHENISVAVKEESPELGQPTMRTIPESDDESSSQQRLASHQEPSAPQDHLFLKPALPASRMNRQQSRENQRDDRDGLSTDAIQRNRGDNTNVGKNISETQVHSSPPLSSSPTVTAARSTDDSVEPRDVAARQNVYEAFDTPERDITVPKTKKLGTYGRFPRTPKLIQNAADHPRSSPTSQGARSSDSRSEPSTSSKHRSFKLPSRDEIEYTPEPNQLSVQRSGSPMHAKKLLGILHESGFSRGGQSLEKPVTPGSEVEDDGQGSRSTPQTSSAKKPSSLKRPSRTSYQLPKSASLFPQTTRTRSKSKTPSRTSTISSRRSFGNDELQIAGDNVSNPASSGYNSSRRSESVLRKESPRIEIVRSLRGAVTPKPSNPSSAKNVSSPQEVAAANAAMAKIEALKRKIAEKTKKRESLDSTQSAQTPNGQSPSSQAGQQSSESSVGQRDKSVTVITEAPGSVEGRESHHYEAVSNAAQIQGKGRASSSSTKLAGSMTHNATTSKSPSEAPQLSKLPASTPSGNTISPLSGIGRTGIDTTQRQNTPKETPVPLPGNVTQRQNSQKVTPVPLPDNVRHLYSKNDYGSTQRKISQSGKESTPSMKSSKRMAPCPAPDTAPAKRARGAPQTGLTLDSSSPAVNINIMNDTESIPGASTKRPRGRPRKSPVPHPVPAPQPSSSQPTKADVDPTATTADDPLKAQAMHQTLGAPTPQLSKAQAHVTKQMRSVTPINPPALRQTVLGAVQNKATPKTLPSSSIPTSGQKALAVKPIVRRQSQATKPAEAVQSSPLGASQEEAIEISSGGSTSSDDSDSEESEREPSVVVLDSKGHNMTDPGSQNALAQSRKAELQDRPEGLRDGTPIRAQNLARQPSVSMEGSQNQIATQNHTNAVASVDLGDLPDAQSPENSSSESESDWEDERSKTTNQLPKDTKVPEEEPSKASNHKAKNESLAPGEGNEKPSRLPETQANKVTAHEEESHPVAAIVDNSYAASGSESESESDNEDTIMVAPASTTNLGKKSVPVAESDSESEFEPATKKPAARFLAQSPPRRALPRQKSASASVAEDDVNNSDSSDDDSDASSVASSPSDMSSSDESSANKDIDMPDADVAEVLPSSPPTFANQAKLRTSKQTATSTTSTLQSSQISTSQLIPQSSAATGLQKDVSSPLLRSKPAPKVAMPARASTAVRATSTTSTTSATAATKPARRTYAKYPTLADQIQEIRRETQASSPPKKKKANAMQTSFTKMMNQQARTNSSFNMMKNKAGGGSKTLLMSESSGEESEEESSGSDSSGDERVLKSVLGGGLPQHKARSAGAVGGSGVSGPNRTEREKPGCSVG